MINTGQWGMSGCDDKLEAAICEIGGKESVCVCVCVCVCVYLRLSITVQFHTCSEPFCALSVII